MAKGDFASTTILSNAPSVAEQLRAAWEAAERADKRRDRDAYDAAMNLVAALEDLMIASNEPVPLPLAIAITRRRVPWLATPRDADEAEATGEHIERFLDSILRTSTAESWVSRHYCAPEAQA